MNIQTRKIIVPEGVFESDFVFFHNSDKKDLQSIFNLWKELSEKLISIGFCEV